MDTNTIIILTAIATLFIATIGIGVTVIIYLSKKIDDKLDNVTNELYNFKIEVSTRLSKIESKLDITDERHNSTNQKVDITNQTTNQRVDKLESDFKEFKADQKSLIDKILDLLPKKPLL